MKKNLLIFVFLIALSSFNYGQIIRGFGLKTGVTIAKQSWDYKISRFSDDYNRTGFNAGLFAEFLDMPFLSVITELNYIQKGMKQKIAVTSLEKPDGTGEYKTQDMRMDYLNISVLGKLRFNTGIISPYIVAGPKIDFEINKKHTIGWDDEFDNNFDKKRPGVKIGVGTEIHLVPFDLQAEFLYDADFNELYKNENMKIDTNSFDFRIGIML